MQIYDTIFEFPYVCTLMHMQTGTVNNPFQLQPGGGPFHTYFVPERKEVM